MHSLSTNEFKNIASRSFSNFFNSHQLRFNIFIKLQVMNKDICHSFTFFFFALKINEVFFFIAFAS